MSIWLSVIIRLVKLRPHCYSIVSPIKATIELSSFFFYFFKGSVTFSSGCQKVFIIHNFSPFSASSHTIKSFKSRDGFSTFLYDSAALNFVEQTLIINSFNSFEFRTVNWYVVSEIHTLISERFSITTFIHELSVLQQTQHPVIDRGMTITNQNDKFQSYEIFFNIPMITLEARCDLVYITLASYRPQWSVTPNLLTLHFLSDENVSIFVHIKIENWTSSLWRVLVLKVFCSFWNIYLQYITVYYLSACLYVNVRK